MTFSDLFKVTIIQRQITWKWYLLWPTNRKSYMICRTAPYSMILNDTCPSKKVWCWISHKRYDIKTYSFNEINLLIVLKLHTSYSPLSFPITLSDLEWLSKIFNDTKRRAVSLRQLSFLCSFHMSYVACTIGYAPAALIARLLPFCFTRMKGVSPCVCHDGSLVVSAMVQLVYLLATTHCCSQRHAN